MNRNENDNENEGFFHPDGSLRFRYRFRPNSSFFILHFSFKAPFPLQYNYP